MAMFYLIAMLKTKKIFLLIVLALFPLFFSEAQAAAADPITPAECQTRGGVCTDTPEDGETCSTGNPQLGICDNWFDDEACCTTSEEDADGNIVGTGTVGGAGTTYVPLENIPFIEGGDFKSYLEGMFRLFLVVTALSAVFMFVIGGFMYLTSAGNTSQIGSARGIITNAILGLVLALISVLILNTINPELTTLNVSMLTPVSPGTISTTDTETGTDTPAVSGTGYFANKTYSGGDVYTHTEAKNALSSSGIGTSSSGNCSSQSNRSCTSLESIPKSTIDFVKKLKADCKCNVIITGGTEVGHSTHGSGRAAIDLGRGGILDFMSKQTKISQSKGRPVYSYGGYRIWDEDSGHFHAWEPK